MERPLSQREMEPPSLDHHRSAWAVSTLALRKRVLMVLFVRSRKADTIIDLPGAAALRIKRFPAGKKKV